MNTIFAGSTPIRNLGAKQFRLIEFALRFPGWHTYATDATRVVLSLERRGVIEHNKKTQQFRFKQV